MRREKGMTLVELLIAMGISVLIMAATFIIVSFSAATYGSTAEMVKEVLFEAVSDTVCCMRQSQPLSVDWSKKINEDYNNRK